MTGRKPGKIPKVVDTTLSFYDEDLEQWQRVLDIHKDWRRWQEWLANEQEKSFRYENSNGTSCTVIKEFRKHFNLELLRPCWYAHKRIDGRLKRKYLGQHSNVTASKLKSVAFELAQPELKEKVEQ